MYTYKEDYGMNRFGVWKSVNEEFSFGHANLELSLTCLWEEVMGCVFLECIDLFMHF